MIRNKEELLEAINAKFTDDTSDDTLSLIEDITDTMTDFETKVADTTDWKTKYEENDAEWRKKYKDRFFSNDEVYPKPKEKDNEENKEITSYEQLFAVKED